MLATPMPDFAARRSSHAYAVGDTVPAMCGIGAIVCQTITRATPGDVASRRHPGHPSDRPEATQDRALIPDSWIEALDAAITDRGAHGHGTHRDRADAVAPEASTSVALLHRRLSIIDHEHGQQPMLAAARSPEEGRLAIVFNGHIVNHRELRAELGSLGHHFTTDHSDTEVLLHGWRAWGVGLRERLEGMYAFAIWDSGIKNAPGTLAVFRDRFGEKPLYVLEEPDQQRLAVCSNAAGLHRLAVAGGWAAGTRIDPYALAHWIAMGYHDIATPWVGIWQLAPDGVGVWTAGKGWSTTVRARKLPGELRRSLPSGESRRQLHARVLGLLEASVGSRLEADVPVGAFLSGGVDSAVVSALAQRAMAARGQTLTTLCVRMPDAAYDESEAAAMVAGSIGSSHHTVDAQTDPASDLIGLIEHLGLPFGDSSLLPTYWVSAAAAETVGVALSGDGGDEMFLGYERHAATEWLNWLSPLAALRLEEALPRSNPKSRSDKLARLLVASREEGYRDLLAIYPSTDRRRLIAGEIGHRAIGDATESTIASAQLFDLRHHMPGDYLRKVDTASMLAGIEVRAPLLDGALSEAVLRLPVRRVREGNKRKGLLRAIARGLLPTEIIDRPKMGFSIPIGRWFHDDHGGLGTLLHDALLSSDPFPGLSDAGVAIDPAHIARMLDEHSEERRDHSQRLYMLLVLSIWCARMRG